MLLAVDQTAADADQTEADSDQTASDMDQAGSDADQVAADHDQHASDRDQAAADLERVSADRNGAPAELHEVSRTERDEATRRRVSTSADRARVTARRLATAERRDLVADARDRTAEARDRAADARDAAAEARDLSSFAREGLALRSGELDEAIVLMREIRAAAESHRADCALERASAAADRESAAADRRLAAADRRHAGVDELTSVFRRGTGELALGKELARSRRSGRPVAFCLIDVDGLKAVNDGQGHPAGDALLREVAAAITSTMRAYDVTVRWGGDEFVCALSDATLEVAAERIEEVRVALRARGSTASISAGFADCRADDTLETLVARADEDLYRRRGRPRGFGSR
jgi:diguanylate cyclase (GGDEF)-like protein